MRELIGRRHRGVGFWRAARVGIPLLAASIGTESQAALSELEALRVVYFKGTSNVVFFQAERKGYFKDQGLAVQLILTSDGTAAVAAVNGGTAEVASAGVAPVLAALAGGARLKMLAGVSHEDQSNIMFHLVASKRSGVQHVADLKGRTILVANDNGLCELAWRDWLARSSVSWSDVKVLRDPFSYAKGLLEVGDADAACLPEPFFSALRLSTPNVVVLASGLLVDEQRPYTIATLVSTESWLSKHSSAISRFKTALDRAANDLRRDPLAYRQLLVTEFGVPGDVVGYLGPAPTLSVPLTEADVLPIVEGMQRNNMLSKRFSFANAIAAP